jgi:hypothetical protein
MKTLLEPWLRRHQHGRRARAGLQGLASGLLNAAAQLETAIGLAVFTSIASRVASDQPSVAALLEGGVRFALAAAAVFALADFLLAH